MYKLNIKKLKKHKQIIKVGELSQDIINILQISQKPKSIKLSYDRIDHCEKHKQDFKNELSYYKSMESIPTIINNPDFVGFDRKNNSIEYIKRIDNITLIAVRLKSKGDLYLRSVYPISEIKLKNKVKAKEYKKVKKMS